jgi:hypothetical protein
MILNELGTGVSLPLTLVYKGFNRDEEKETDKSNSVRSVPYHKVCQRTSLLWFPGTPVAGGVVAFLPVFAILREQNNITNLIRLN